MYIDEVAKLLDDIAISGETINREIKKLNLTLNEADNLTYDLDRILIPKRPTGFILTDVDYILYENNEPVGYITRDEKYGLVAIRIKIDGMIYMTPYY